MSGGEHTIPTAPRRESGGEHTIPATTYAPSVVPMFYAPPVGQLVGVLPNPDGSAVIVVGDDHVATLTPSESHLNFRITAGDSFAHGVLDFLLDAVRRVAGGKPVVLAADGDYDTHDASPACSGSATAIADASNGTVGEPADGVPPSPGAPLALSGDAA